LGKEEKKVQQTPVCHPVRKEKEKRGVRGGKSVNFLSFFS